MYQSWYISHLVNAEKAFVLLIEMPPGTRHSDAQIVQGREHKPDRPV